MASTSSAHCVTSVAGTTRKGSTATPTTSARCAATYWTRFAAGGSGRHRTSVFDVSTDTPGVTEQNVAPPGAVLVVDGMFLHRPELRRCWTWSIWLEVDPGTSVRRCLQRDGRSSSDPAALGNRRYVEGQQMYLRDADPRRDATHLVDNNDLLSPRLLR